MPAGEDEILIQVDRVGKVFPSRSETAKEVVALKDISFPIRSREFCCVLGPSGCGKSTFLNIVAGLIPLSSGRILIRGQEVREPGLDRGVVFQEHGLFPWRTTLGNVEFPLEMANISRSERKVIARKSLEIVGIAEFERSFPFQLSGGMKQRAGLARALALDPEILLMDEPFASVDAITRRELQDHLLRIWVLRRKTVLFVTHSVEEAVFLAGTVIVLTPRPGRVQRRIEIGLPRPRQRSSASFLAVKKELERELGLFESNEAGF